MMSCMVSRVIFFEPTIMHNEVLLTEYAVDPVGVEITIPSACTVVKCSSSPNSSRRLKLALGPRSKTLICMQNRTKKRLGLAIGHLLHPLAPTAKATCICKLDGMD